MSQENDPSSLSAFCKANFNPYQPRDEHGCWSNEDCKNNVNTSFIAYNGKFHDIVVDDLLDGLEKDGSTVLKNVWVVGVNGLSAIPDGMSRPKGADKPYFLEMKTGGDPKFTPNQLAVYPLICLGGHVTSFNPRVSQLGLTPGLPFPPMRILLVATAGPGQPISYIDYCKSIGREVP